MFTTVRSTTVFAGILLGALLLWGTQPMVAFSQQEPPSAEEGAVQGSTDPEDLAQVSEEVTIESSEEPSSVYRIEDIPGTNRVIGDFVIGPGKADFEMNPGETKIFQITVTNRTGEYRQFNLTVEDATGSKDSNQTMVLLGDDRGPYSLKDYLSFPAPSFRLEHNERAVIPITISIPEDAEPGGLYGSVLADTVAIEGEAGDTGGAVPQSAIIARIGTLFFITIPGDIDRSGSLVDFTTLPKHMFFQEGPIDLGMSFENTGSIHLAPYGEVRITNMLGEEVGFVEIDPWFVMPGSTRLREIEWDREFLFGQYKAVAKINRSYDDVVDTMELTFWVLPWKILAGAFAIIFVVVFLIRAFFRTFEFKRKGD